MIPKKLTEQREDLVTEHFGTPDRSAYVFAGSYRQGFDAACELLLPEMEKMAEALDRLTKSDVVRTAQFITYSEAYLNAEEALTFYNTLMGESDE